MTQATAAAESAPSAPAVGQVFDALVSDIVSGKYPGGTRLPAERELARMLGASRPTLREALRRMSEWGLVEARRGSGVVVRERRWWTIEIVPSFLKFTDFKTPGTPGLGRVMADMLTLRRTVIASVLPGLVERIDAAGVELARTKLRAAWEARRDVAAFARLDLEFLVALFEAASMLPAIWLYNSIARVYLDLVPTLGAAIAPPDDYLSALSEFLDAVADNDSSLAFQRLNDYYERTDGRLAPLLETLGA